MASGCLNKPFGPRDFEPGARRRCRGPPSRQLGRKWEQETSDFVDTRLRVHSSLEPWPSTLRPGLEACGSPTAMRRPRCRRPSAAEVDQDGFHCFSTVSCFSCRLPNLVRRFRLWITETIDSQERQSETESQCRGANWPVFGGPAA